jgi:hypothetical protein
MKKLIDHIEGMSADEAVKAVAKRVDIEVLEDAIQILMQRLMHVEAFLSKRPLPPIPKKPSIININ